MLSTYRQFGKKKKTIFHMLAILSHLQLNELIFNYQDFF